MESNSIKSKLKIVAIVVAISIAVLTCVISLSFGLYKVFYNNNKKAVTTMSYNNVDVQKDEEQITINLNETPLDVIEEEEEKVEEKELTEEEKQKIAEERKKQEEARKKREEEQRKLASQGYPYWIKVNYKANTTTVYAKDANGDYTVPVRAMVCSTGRQTPHSGVYKTSNKYRWGTLIGPVWGQYCTRITGGILFHSVPYLKKNDNSSLEYWEYDRLGETRSLGCIRLTVIDAKWIYDNCPSGTSVEFYGSDDPGPLGKPGYRKVSSYEDLKGWDPTDPDSNNPWRNQDALEAQKKAEEEAKKAEEAAKKAKEEQEAQEAERQKAEAEEERRKQEAAAEEERKNNVVVKNVVGLAIEEAKAILTEQGFTYNVVEATSYNPTKAENVVISQTPNGGNSANKKTTIVTLIVNPKKTNELENSNDEDDSSNDNNTINDDEQDNH